MPRRSFCVVVAVTFLLVSLAGSLQAAPTHEVYRWKLLYLLYPNTFAAEWDDGAMERVVATLVEHRDWYETITGDHLWLQFGYAQVDRFLGPFDVSSVVKDGGRKYQLRPDDVRQDLVRLGVPEDVYGTIGALNAWANNKYGGRQAGGMAFPGPHLHSEEKDANFWSVGYRDPVQNGFALFHEFTHCVHFVFKESGLGVNGNIDSIRDYVAGIVASRPGWYEPSWSDAAMISAAQRRQAGGPGLTSQQQARSIAAFLDRPHEEFLQLSTDYGEVVPAPVGFRFEPLFHEIYGEPGLRVYLPVIARDENKQTPQNVEVVARAGKVMYQLKRHHYQAATDGRPFERDYFAGWVELPAGTTNVELELRSNGTVTQQVLVPVTLRSTSYVKGEYEVGVNLNSPEASRLIVQVVSSQDQAPISGVELVGTLGQMRVPLRETTPGSYEMVFPADTPLGTHDLVVAGTKEGTSIAPLVAKVTAEVSWEIVAATKMEVALGDRYVVSARVVAAGKDEPNVEMVAAINGEQIPMRRGEDGVFQVEMPGLFNPNRVLLVATKKGGASTTKSVEVTVSGGRIVPLQESVTSRPGGEVTLAIKCVSLSGALAKGNSFPTIPAMVGWNFTSFKDEDGDGIATATLSNLAAGTYTVPLRAPGYAEAEIVISVK